MNMRYVFVFTLSSLVILGSLGTAQAEDNVDFGVFGAISGMYDDNILYDSDNELDDFITTALVGLGFLQEGKTHSMRLEGSIAHSIFAEHDSFSNTAQYLDFEFSKEVSPLQFLTVSNNFEHAETPDSFEESLGRETGRYEFFDNDFEIEYRRELDFKKSYDVTYGNEIYTASREDIPDSVEHLFGFGWNYRADPANTYSAKYEFDYAQYEDSENAQTHKVFGRWAHLFDKRTELRTDAGVSFINSFDDENLVRPYALLAFHNDLTRDTQIELRLKKEYEPSRFRSDILDLWEVSAEVYKQLNRRLSGRFTAFFGMGEYIKSGVEDQLVGVRVGMEYTVKEDVAVFVNFLNQTNDSNTDSRDYKKNQISAGIRIEF